MVYGWLWIWGTWIVDARVPYGRTTKWNKNFKPNIKGRLSSFFIVQRY